MTAATALLAALLITGVASAAETTMGRDTLRTSWDPTETALGPGAVSSSSFGQLFATKLDGQVYAQPLVVGGAVLAATENNKVYALDRNTGAQLWTRDLGPAWPVSNVSCGDLTPTIGVTSTPVYDPVSGSLYLTAKVNDGADASNPHWYVHALDPATGAERAGWPVVVQGAPTNDPANPFHPRTAMQRPGLLLLGGVVYAGFASHCDTAPFVGYVVGVDTRTAKQTTMWATESGNSSAEGGIWQSGGGLVSDGSGRIYFATGNGISPVAGPGKQPQSTLAESVVALTVQADGSLKATDFFSPSNNAKLDQDDTDLGSGGPLALPDGYGTTAHPHLLVQVGKDGRVYLLDRDDLGGMGQGAGGGDAVLGTAGPYGGVWGKPGFFGDGSTGYVYTVENQGYLRAYKVVRSSTGGVSLAAIGASAGTFGYTSGSPAITSNGTDPASALVWVLRVDGPGGGNPELRAYSALPASGVLQLKYAAPLKVGTAAAVGAKFTSVATDGNRVYVGTRSGVLYGFGAPTTAALAASPTTFADTPVGGAPTSATVALTANRALTLASAPTATAPFAVVSAPAAGSAFAAGAQLAVTVSFTPTTAGQIAGSLSLTTTAGETVALDLHALATRPGLAASPASVDFGSVPTGSGTNRTVNVVNTGTQPVEIHGLTGPQAPGLTADPSWDTTVPTVTLAPQASAVLALTYLPTAAGPLADRLTVLARLTGTEGTAEVDLPIDVRGTAITGASHLTVPAGLDLGSVPVGLSTTASFGISNDGNIPMTITKAKAPAGVFSTSKPIPEGLVIPPGGSAYQTVTFTPTAAGPVSGSFYEITADDGTGAHQVALTGTGANDPIAVKFQQLGGGKYGNGNPVGQVAGVETTIPGGMYEKFTNGYIVWSPATGAHVVYGAIAVTYAAWGGPTGALGFPTTDETGTPDGVGRFNHFTKNGWNSSIYWTPTTGAHEIGGAIRDRWAAMGWENGLGYPTTDETGTPDRIGRFNHFTKNASIYWTPTTGAHEVSGAIRAKWASLGWENGIGYPVTDSFAVTGGRREQFQRGTLTWVAATGVVTLTR